MEKIQEFIIVDLVKVTGVTAPLVQAMLVSNGTHQLFLPLTIGEAVVQPVLHVNEGVTVHASEVEISDKEADHKNIECTLSIEEQEEDWLMVLVEGLLDSFSD